MHRLENLLVAIELKDVFTASFPEGIEISAYRVLEALTTEKCSERFSLERLEVLGDAFLKYAVGRHSFLSYEGLDEGQLTMKRSSIVNNSHLYELALRKNLQVYIRDESFDPSQFFALGRPCKVICNKDTESDVHCRAVGAESSNVKCNKSHRWLHRKTIADAVEALTGAFLVDSGFRAASAFLQWIGIQVNFDISDVYRICEESKNNMSVINNIEIAALEKLLGYSFQHRGLLLQAFIHPSYNKHSGGCYQRLEFLGDAVLEYLITSYLYSVYPALKPGQLTDLRSITVNNISFAHRAVSLSFHKYLMKDSDSLTEAINKFERYVDAPESEKELIEEPSCPKVLGDLVESCIGAMLLDSGFDLKHVWKTMLSLLYPVLRFSSLQLNPVRELWELCQSYDFKLSLPDPVKVKEGYVVKVIVTTEEGTFTSNATNRNSKTARKGAAQEVISKLKALGFKHKSKTLEEIVRSTQKEEPKLIGFDEKPVISEVSDTVRISPLKQDEPEENSSLGPLSDESISSGPSSDEVLDASLDSNGDTGKAFHEQTSPPSATVHECRAKICKANNSHKGKQMSRRQVSGPSSDEALDASLDSSGSTGKAFHRQTSPPSTTVHEHRAEICKANNSHKDKRMSGGKISGTALASDCSIDEGTEVLGAPGKNSAKAKLFEICTANYWNPPSFFCCKEEGDSHLKMFTYKVTIKVEAASPTILECFSEPKPKKKAAQQHAAEGALWYLKHMGYLS